VQPCLLNGKPLKKQDYQQLLEAADSYQAISKALPRIRLLANCGFVDRAFHAILNKDCKSIKRTLWRMMIAAILSAIGITLAAFYFCVCFRCAFARG
jgi:mannose/fructose/N-acetylgalactosamine-specific phosphotransferase system component IIC